MYVDAHAHLDDKWIVDDIAAVIKRAKDVGISAIIQNGINHKTNEASLALAKKYPILKVAMGIYPGEMNEDVEKSITFIRSHKKDICAIGEVGLDGTYENMALQQEIFSKMISLAKELDKPISIHTRKAEELVLKQLTEEKASKAHLHCFMGSRKLVKESVKAGHYFSIPCTIERSTHFQEIAKIVPLNLLLTETDSPYLGAVKGERNEPAKIVECVKKIAEIKGIEVEEMKKILFMNYQRLFS